jgi:hypothetical protein
MKNGRNDEIDVAQNNRNIEVALNSTRCSPQNEDIIAGDADWGEVLYTTMPEDNVGFLPSNQKK